MCNREHYKSFKHHAPKLIFVYMLIWEKLYINYDYVTARKHSNHLAIYLNHWFYCQECYILVTIAHNITLFIMLYWFIGLNTLQTYSYCGLD